MMPRLEERLRFLFSPSKWLVPVVFAGSLLFFGGARDYRRLDRRSWHPKAYTTRDLLGCTCDGCNGRDRRGVRYSHLSTCRLAQPLPKCPPTRGFSDRRPRLMIIDQDRRLIMPTTIGFTFTAIPAGDGIFCIQALQEDGNKLALPSRLGFNQEHHSIQLGNWLMICKTTLPGLSLSNLSNSARSAKSLALTSLSLGSMPAC